MSSNIINQVAYLRTSREFPNDLNLLSVQVDKSYVEIANAVNTRTIGIFPTNRPAITGESWFLTGNRRQQSLRQVYKITSYAPFDHNIDFAEVSFFSKITGIGFQGTNYFPIPFVYNTIANSNVGIYVNPTQVVFDTGVNSPVLVSGIIILEWISDA